LLIYLRHVNYIVNTIQTLNHAFPVWLKK
jgi:hypothetical protein